MPRVLIKESNFDQLQNNLAYTIIIRQHGFIIKQITNDESLESVFITKIEPSDIKKFQLVEKNKEYILYSEITTQEDKTYSFAMTSLELPVGVLFDKIMKVIDPTYEEKSLLSEETQENLSLVEVQNEKPFLIALDRFLKKTQSTMARPLLKGMKIIQLGIQGIERSIKFGIETITKPFNKQVPDLEPAELLEKDAQLPEFLIQINKVYLNHVDSSLLVNVAKLHDSQSELLLIDHSRKDPIIEKYPIVVFLHPFGLELTMWKPYINYFVNKGYRAIAYDMRGWGGSEQHKNDDYKFSDYYDDFKALVEEKRLLEGEQELIIVTASLTGLMLLNKLDSSITKRKNIKLILISSTDHISKDLQDMIKKIPHPRTWGPLKRLGKKKIKEVVLTKGITNTQQEEIVAKLLSSDNKVTYETLKNLRDKEYIEGLSEKQLDQFPFEKTLIILGEKDPFIPVENVKHLEDIENVTISVIEEGNHFIAFEKPEVVVKEIDAWLASKSLQS